MQIKGLELVNFLTSSTLAPAPGNMKIWLPSGSRRPAWFSLFLLSYHYSLLLSCDLHHKKMSIIKTRKIFLAKPLKLVLLGSGKGKIPFCSKTLENLESWGKVNRKYLSNMRSILETFCHFATLFVNTLQIDPEQNLHIWRYDFFQFRKCPLT